MGGKRKNFDDKKISKSNLYINKKILKIEESYGTKKIHLNISLDIMMMMMSLDHYVSSFLKRLVMLNVLVVIRQSIIFIIF